MHKIHKIRRAVDDTKKGLGRLAAWREAAPDRGLWSVPNVAKIMMNVAKKVMNNPALPDWIFPDTNAD